MKPSRRHSLPLSASSWTLYQEVFENEYALTGVQSTTTTHACYFAIGCRGSFDPDNFVLRPAVGTMVPGTGTTQLSFRNSGATHLMMPLEACKQTERGARYALQRIPYWCV